MLHAILVIPTTVENILLVVSCFFKLFIHLALTLTHNHLKVNYILSFVFICSEVITETMSKCVKNSEVTQTAKGPPLMLSSYF